VHTKRGRAGAGDEEVDRLIGSRSEGREPLRGQVLGRQDQRNRAFFISNENRSSGDELADGPLRWRKRVVGEQRHLGYERTDRI
jgi:hypothetical protein